MKKINVYKNQQGISLVELLASIALVSIIVVFVFGILLNGQKQYSAQSEKNQNQQSIAYAMKVLTKEIRQSPDSVTIKSPNEIVISGVTYKLSGNNLMESSTVLVRNIQTFEVKEDPVSKTIFIKIVSSTGEEVSTQIAKRS